MSAREFKERLSMTGFTDVTVNRCPVGHILVPYY